MLKEINRGFAISSFIVQSFRKIRLKKVSAIVAGIIFSFLLQSSVEATEKKYSFGFTVGISRWPSDVFHYTRMHADRSFTSTWRRMNSLEQEITLKTIYNLSIQYNFSPHFGLRGDISHQSANYQARYALIPKNPGLRNRYTKHSLPWSVTSVILNAVFQARKSGGAVIPYGFIGLGFCLIQGEKEKEEKFGYMIEIRSAEDIAVKAGGGFSFYLFKSFPLGIDLRAFVTALGASLFSFYSSYEGSDMGGTIIAQGWNLIWGIEIGARYGF